MRKSKVPQSTPPANAAQPKISTLDDPSNPQDIFSLSDRNRNLVLQSATLIRGLLQKTFASSTADIQQLQCSDLKLRALYDKAKEGSQNYVIISKILYKVGQHKSKILCVPELLCRQIVYDSHAKSGFHFKVHQLGPILKPLIYHPNLQNMIEDTVGKRY